jgi:hypothetical protein
MIRKVRKEPGKILKEEKDMTIQINQTALDEFQKSFKGKIIVPDDPTYDKVRSIFNAMINKRPGCDRTVCKRR